MEDLLFGNFDLEFIFIRWQKAKWQLVSTSIGLHWIELFQSACSEKMSAPRKPKSSQNVMLTSNYNHSQKKKDNRIDVILLARMWF
jgi:hypothetical protein